MKNVPAFPLHRNYVEHSQYKGEIFSQGMTLRDYFAGKAMQGILANSKLKIPNETAFTDVAEDSYDYADAMLAERSKEGES